MRRPTTIALIGAVLLLLALPAETGNAAVPSGPDDPGTDVIFLVDASGSVQSTDPHSARRTVIRAIIDLALRRGGDRVAVYRFAGRRETAERAAEARTQPLTRVPGDATREEVLGQLHAAAGRAAEIFPGAQATDFNAAFEVGLSKILRERSDVGRPVWVILLSDGDSEVERGALAHAAYVEEAQRRYGKTLTRYLNKAATDLLREKVLPEFDGAGRFFTAINVAAPEVSDGDALAAVAARGAGGEVLRVTDRPLRDLILPAFRTAPGRLGRPVAQGIAYESFTIDGSVERRFRTCGRLGRTGVLVFADSPDYEIELAKPDGEPLTEGSIEISGHGERYRVVTVAGLPGGEYRLTIRGKSPIRAERIIYHEMDVAVEAALVDRKDTYRPGETVDVDLRLVDRASGRAVVDADVLLDVTAAVRVETPAGPVDVGEVALAEAPGGTARVTWSIPAGAERGAWIVDARAEGLRDPGGEPGLRAEARGAERFDVTPAIAVTWTVGEIDVNGVAALRGLPPAGALPVEAPVPVRLVQNDGDGTRTTSLRFSAESGAWVANVDGLAQGDWHIQSPPGARVEILTGRVGTLHVVHPTASVPFPWIWVVLGALALTLLLAFFGIARTMRRRAAPAVVPAEAETFTSTALVDDETDEEDLLLDDEDVEDFLAEIAAQAEEDDDAPRAPTGGQGDAMDIETLILEE